MQQEFVGLSAPTGYTLGPCIGGLAGRTLVFAGVRANGQPCALKTIDPRAAGDVLVQARFAAELKWHTLANDCEGVAPLIAQGDSRWLISEWAHGGSLAEFIDRHTQVRDLAEIDAVSIVAALLTICRAIHARDVVHRDIKPSNVLRDGDRYWLTDFGLAAGRDSGGIWRALPDPWVETEIGSPDWAAPELLAGSPLTHPANDVYGVSRVWEALADCVPDEQPQLRRLRAAMLQTRISDRPTIDEVLSELRTLGDA